MPNGHRFFLLLTVFSVAVWFSRDLLLRDSAELWIVFDALGPADAVAVLGGGLPTRPFAAAEVLSKGPSQKSPGIQSTPRQVGDGCWFAFPRNLLGLSS